MRVSDVMSSIKNYASDPALFEPYTKCASCLKRVLLDGQNRDVPHIIIPYKSMKQVLILYNEA